MESAFRGENRKSGSWDIDAIFGSLSGIAIADLNVLALLRIAGVAGAMCSRLKETAPGSCTEIVPGWQEG